MKNILISSVIALGAIGHAQAQTTSATATQNSAAQSTAQGTIEFSQTPEHTSQTVRNVSAPILGAYASSFSQMNCASTTQLGGAVAGFSIGGGTSKDSASCVLEVAAAELTRQATVDNRGDSRDMLLDAAIGVRCQISPEVYNAMRDAGFACTRKPKGMDTPQIARREH